MLAQQITDWLDSERGTVLINEHHYFVDWRSSSAPQMAKGYPPEFRQRVIDLVEGGRRVAEIAAELGISEQSVYTWRRQARIDAGIEPGLSTAEQAELVSARKRIRELETELAIHRRAMELLKGVVDPKGGSRPSR